MNLKGRGDWYIALFSLLASALIPYFIITPNYFPFLGLSLSCILFATLLFIAKKDKSRFHTFLFICSLSVAIFLITRSQPFLTFLNILGWFYAAALLGIVNQYHRLSFTTMLLAPYTFFFGGLTTSNTAYTLNIKNAIKKNISHKLNAHKKHHAISRNHAVTAYYHRTASCISQSFF